MCFTASYLLKCFHADVLVSHEQPQIGLTTLTHLQYVLCIPVFRFEGKQCQPKNEHHQHNSQQAIKIRSTKRTGKELLNLLTM